jgi:hypothetical protein
LPIVAIPKPPDIAAMRDDMIDERRGRHEPARPTVDTDRITRQKRSRASTPARPVQARRRRPAERVIRPPMHGTPIALDELRTARSPARSERRHRHSLRPGFLAPQRSVRGCYDMSRHGRTAFRFCKNPRKYADPRFDS